MNSVMDNIRGAIASGKRMLAVLIDPEKFPVRDTGRFFAGLPVDATHIFVGGSTVETGTAQKVMAWIKEETALPVVLFPGSYSQITNLEDAILFLSLISGRNAEYLIGQHIKAVPVLKDSVAEIIPTGYVLIDGGAVSAVQKVTGTIPLCQNDIEAIVHTAIAGELIGNKLLYLEAGSGAKIPVAPEIILAVKKAVSIPLIVGGGIRSARALEEAYEAGADLVVIGTALEEGSFKTLVWS